MAQSKAFTSSIIERPLPSAVIYDLCEPHQVTITLPIGSTWSSGLHWHEDHVEYLRVIRGRVRVRLGGSTRTIDAGTEVRVDRNVWHEWSRAGPDGEDVVVVERTDPEDGQKAVFFWNLNGVILKAGEIAPPPYVPEWVHDLLLDVWVALNLFVIFRYLDNVPVFLDVVGFLGRWGVAISEGSTIWLTSKGIDRVWSHLVLMTAGWLGWLFGIKAVREEFTPQEAIQRWMHKGDSKEAKEKPA
ncbi:hypothetical protein NKR23_g3197 [Pleurostoma richardsiae]|uniref:Cupin type-2 domain-containing protein n=1 Tax=Pleurostoma richardsiae TaxID=41990 RepID=A0AA38VM49_9PEZI|nr:hypothetical protein NKR23_g3197 [Pleurostoma richardsiae]